MQNWYIFKCWQHNSFATMTTHLRLVAELQAPWIVLVNNNNRRCRGLQCDLLNYLSRSLNFTYEISSTKEGPGLELANGSWTGLIGKIQSNVSVRTFDSWWECHHRRQIWPLLRSQSVPNHFYRESLTSAISTMSRNQLCWLVYQLTEPLALFRAYSSSALVLLFSSSLSLLFCFFLWSLTTIISYNIHHSLKDFPIYSSNFFFLSFTEVWISVPIDLIESQIVRDQFEDEELPQILDFDNPGCLAFIVFVVVEFDLNEDHFRNERQIAYASDRDHQRAGWLGSGHCGPAFIHWPPNHRR